MASNGIRPFVRGMDEERLRANGIRILHYKYKGNGVGASWPQHRSVTLPLMSRKLACATKRATGFGDLLRHRALDEAATQLVAQSNAIHLLAKLYVG
jgi:hypothetical protein